MRQTETRIKRIWKVLVEELALFSIEYLLVLASGIACLLIFYKFADALLRNQLQNFDDNFTAYVQSFASPGMDTFMKSITFMGNFEFMIFPFFLVFIYFLFIKPHRWFSIKVPVVAVGSITTNLILKRIYERPRPEIEHLVQASGLSFPSGHAMFSFSFFGLLIYICWHFIKNKFWRNVVSMLLLTLTILIGISRVYVGVHYPSDVLAGFSAGLFWLLISLMIITIIEKRLEKVEGNTDLAM
jgi:membrane-associated phospholipid phosphatase